MAGGNAKKWDVEKCRQHISVEMEFYYKETKLTEAFLEHFEGLVTKDDILKIPNQQNQALQFYTIILQKLDEMVIDLLLKALRGTEQTTIASRIEEAAKLERLRKSIAYKVQRFLGLKNKRE